MELPLKLEIPFLAATKTRGTDIISPKASNSPQAEAISKNSVINKPWCYKLEILWPVHRTNSPLINGFSTELIVCVIFHAHRNISAAVRRSIRSDPCTPLAIDQSLPVLRKDGHPDVFLTIRQSSHAFLWRTRDTPPFKPLHSSLSSLPDEKYFPFLLYLDFDKFSKWVTFSLISSGRAPVAKVWW